MAGAAAPNRQGVLDMHLNTINNKSHAFLDLLISICRGFEGFTTVPGPVHGWRCRAKLARCFE
jgi:hypothetical protein